MSDQTSLKTHLIELTLQVDELRGGVHLCDGASVHYYDPRIQRRGKRKREVKSQAGKKAETHIWPL